MKYTQEQLDFVYKNRKLPRDELTRLFNNEFDDKRKHSQIKSLCARKKWHNGLDGRFKNGHTTWNKGLKCPITPGQRKTMFKKGRKNDDEKPLGSERIDRDGYTYVKTQAPNVWNLKHRIVWEHHHGEIPKGHIIRFTDNDKSNFDINNLEMVTQDENLRLNRIGYKNYPDELKPCIRTVIKIDSKIHQLNK